MPRHVHNWRIPRCWKAVFYTFYVVFMLYHTHTHTHTLFSTCLEKNRTVSTFLFTRCIIIYSIHHMYIPICLYSKNIRNLYSNVLFISLAWQFFFLVVYNSINARSRTHWIFRFVFLMYEFLFHLYFAFRFLSNNKKSTRWISHGWHWYWHLRMCFVWMEFSHHRICRCMTYVILYKGDRWIQRAGWIS